MIIYFLFGVFLAQNIELITQQQWGLLQSLFLWWGAWMVNVSLWRHPLRMEDKGIFFIDLLLYTNVQRLYKREIHCRRKREDDDAFISKQEAEIYCNWMKKREAKTRAYSVQKWLCNWLTWTVTFSSLNRPKIKSCVHLHLLHTV